jgi:hypothetical protein
MIHRKYEKSLIIKEELLKDLKIKDETSIRDNTIDDSPQEGIIRPLTVLLCQTKDRRG